MKTFNRLAINGDDYYDDFELTDNSPNSDRRVWIITHSLEDDKWWGMLRRSDTPESEFKDGVYLPAKMVNAIRHEMNLTA